MTEEDTVRQAPKSAQICLPESLGTAFQSSAEVELGKWAQGYLGDAEHREQRGLPVIARHTGRATAITGRTAG